MNNSKHSQKQTSGNIDEAIIKAKEHFHGVTKKPYYNEHGFIAHPLPDMQGQEINNPRHNPFDEPTTQEWWMDNEQHEL